MQRVVKNEEAADALRELGNIAFSHAATALATLLNRRVDVSIPSVRMLDRDHIARELHARNEAHCVVSFRLAGDHSGMIAVLFPEVQAWNLLHILNARPEGTGEMDAESKNTLQEVANIMAGSALLAIYRMLGTTLLHSIPTFHWRTTEQLALDTLCPGPVALVVEAEFIVEQRRARGTMVISPNDPAPFLASLGILLEGDT